MKVNVSTSVLIFFIFIVPNEANLELKHFFFSKSKNIVDGHAFFHYFAPVTKAIRRGMNMERRPLLLSLILRLMLIV